MEEKKHKHRLLFLGVTHETSSQALVRMHQAIGMNVSCTQQALNKCLLHQNLIWECLPYWIIKFPKAGTILLHFLKNPFGPCSKIFVNQMAFLLLLKQLRAEGTLAGTIYSFDHEFTQQGFTDGLLGGMHGARNMAFSNFYARLNPPFHIILH